MKKFGFGKKKDGEGSSGTSSPAQKNPYATPTAGSDPYADSNKYANVSPYAAAKAQYGPPGSTLAPRDYAPSVASTAAPSYTTQPQNGYGPERFGNGGGYGNSSYGIPDPTRSYGNLGRSRSNETVATEAYKEELFGDARARQAQRQQQQQLPPDNAQSDGGYGAADGYGQGSAYGQQRELTEEEQEEEDVQATKQEIKFMKQEDVSSTRNALRIAQQAEETGRATLARLGAQGERIHNTEKNLDLAANHNRIAEEKAKELRTLNRSMFAVSVKNPFTASQRRAQRDEQIMEKHRSERAARDETRRDAYGTQQRMDANFRELDRSVKPKTMNKASLAERAKYQFEADSDDEAMENEIDSNLDALSGAAGRLNMLARATGEEVERQNDVLDRVARKTDKVDDQIAMNRARLDRIH